VSRTEPSEETVSHREIEVEDIKGRALDWFGTVGREDHRCDFSDSTVTVHAEIAEAPRNLVIRHCSAPFDWSACREQADRAGDESAKTNGVAIQVLQTPRRFVLGKTRFAGAVASVFSVSSHRSRSPTTGATFQNSI
jgi:hypothetical protein